MNTVGNWLVKITYLFLRMPPYKWSECGSKLGVKADKKQLNYAFNASAEHKSIKPSFIINANKLAFSSKKNGETLGFYHHKNTKEMMMFELFNRYFTKSDQALPFQNWHILILVDNLRKNQDTPNHKLTRIHSQFFAPNFTP